MFAFLQNQLECSTVLTCGVALLNGALSVATFLVMASAYLY